MDDRELGQYVMRQCFGQYVPGHPLTEVSRQVLMQSIRDIVRRAMRRNEPPSRLDQVIREIAARASSETSSESDVDEADRIETICQKILEYVVVDVRNSERADNHAFDTIDDQHDTTEQ